MVGAGTCSITASQSGSDNYNAATDVTQTFPAKADQTIDFTDPSDTTFAPAGTVSLTASASSGLDVSFAEQRCKCLHGVWSDGDDGGCGDVFDHRVAGGQ